VVEQRRHRRQPSRHLDDPGRPQDQGLRPSIPSDEALRPAGRLETTANLRRLIPRAERTSKNLVKSCLVAEIGAFDHWRPGTKHRRELALQRPVGGLRISLIRLRGDLDQIAAMGGRVGERLVEGLGDVGGRRRIGGADGLAEFSNKQSKLLCERKSLCGTIDAHYALLLSQTPTVKLLSSKEEAALKPKDIFKECDECPEMVVVPSVASAHQFAVGRYAVTFAEWDACVADMGCEQRPDAGWGRGRRPAINVSWHDAKSYVAWLTNKTGKPYRLLTEKEHEYAARAGTETPFWWGSTISTSQANYDGGFVFGEGAKGQFRAQTMPVDSFNPNPWGLYQVHGNVSEWTEDCDKSYAPTDQTNSDCRSRVIRGGSWWDIPISLRSGSRDRLADSSDNKIGFRVARTIGNVAPLFDRKAKAVAAEPERGNPDRAYFTEQLSKAAYDKERLRTLRDRCMASSECSIEVFRVINKRLAI
jgi:formylglycine-generating enzyme required for sulfatase activity